MKYYFLIAAFIIFNAVAFSSAQSALNRIQNVAFSPGEVLTYRVHYGFIDAGEDVQKAIARELLEETGYEFTSYDYLGKIASNPGMIDNFTYLYLARGGKKIGAQQLDHNEEIELLTVPLEKFRQMLQQNEIVQSLHMACAYYAFQKIDAEKL